ncbi:MAG TPA: signal peptidase I [Candidatus Saccharimonadia bacterium]|nr:signal peptidase I [Candidatus Saccharimonadia bacterium]
MQRIAQNLCVPVFILLCCAVFLQTPRTVYADSEEFDFLTQCTSDETGAYTAIISTQAVKDIYAKLGTRGQKLTISAYQINEDRSGGCKSISTSEINGDSWTRIGSLIPSKNRVVLEIISPQLANVPNANRPSVLLIDPAKPICTPTIECDITLHGKRAFIRSPSTLNDKVSLQVFEPIDPATDILQKVNYYVDGEQQYSTSTLQPFDMRYVSYPDQELLAVANYKSGQQIVYPSRSPLNFKDSPWNLLFRLYEPYPTVTRVVSIGLAVMVFLLLLRTSIRAYIVRYRRLINRNLVTASSIPDKLGAALEKRLEKVDAIVQDFLVKQKGLVRAIMFAWIVPLAIWGCYYVTTTYVFNIYYVNGHSMDSTFHDKQPLFVNKIPQTFAHINGRQMTVHRGEVVVLNAIYGLVTANQVEANQHIIIKRVLGLPGERVVVKDGLTEVFNQEHPDGIDVDTGSPWAATMHKDPALPSIDLTLTSDEIFVSGDNRPVSVDSRINGPVRIQQVIGQVLNTNGTD